MMGTLPKFTTDYLHELGGHFDAIAYGDTWNGWATPVVTRATFVAMAELLSDDCSLGFDENGVATFTEGGEDIETYTHVIAPNADGGFDLGCLGWCFDTL